MFESVELAGILWESAPNSVAPAPDDGQNGPAVFAPGGQYHQLFYAFHKYQDILRTVAGLRQFFRDRRNVELAQLMCSTIHQVNGVAQMRVNLRAVVKLDAQTIDDWHPLSFVHTFMMFILVKAGHLTVDDVFRVARDEYGCTSMLVAAWLAHMSKLGRLVPSVEDKFEMTRSCIPGLEDAGMEYLVRQLMAQGLYADAEDRTLMQVAMGEYLVRPMMRALRGQELRVDCLLRMFLFKDQPRSRDVWWNSVAWLVQDDVLDLDDPDDLDFSPGCTECVLMMDHSALVVEALVNLGKLEFLIEPGGLLAPSRAVWILLTYQSVEIVIALCNKYDELMDILLYQWPLLVENTSPPAFEWDWAAGVVDLDRKNNLMYGGDDEDPDEE